MPDPHPLFHPALFLAGAGVALVARRVPPDGRLALTLAAVPYLGFALTQWFC